MEPSGLYRTTDVKTCAYLLYNLGAKLLRVEPVEADRPSRLQFVLGGVPPGARTAPAEGELVELPRYLRAFEKAKAAMTIAARPGGLRT